MSAMERFGHRFPARWEPLWGVRSLQDEMNRMFADFFTEPTVAAPSAFTPPLDVVDGKDEVVVKAELPGMRKEEVEITLKDDVLTISGEKKVEKEEKKENRYYYERSYGQFARSLTIPSKVKADQVKARCAQRGLLLATVGQAMLRLLPPLVLSDAEADRGLSILDEVLTAV